MKYLWFNSCKLHVVHSLQKNGCLGHLFKVPAACSTDVHTQTVTASWVLEKCMNLDFWFVLSSSGVNKKDVLWIHRRIHPSFFCSLSGFGSWGQPSEQRSPDFPQPNHLFQLIRGHWSVPKPVERCNLCSESCEFIFSLSCLHRTVGAAMHLCRI